MVGKAMGDNIESNKMGNQNILFDLFLKILKRRKKKSTFRDVNIRSLKSNALK